VNQVLLNYRILQGLLQRSETNEHVVGIDCSQPLPDLLGIGNLPCLPGDVESQYQKAVALA
jgi:hypothetical protein